MIEMEIIAYLSQSIHASVIEVLHINNRQIFLILFFSYENAFDLIFMELFEDYIGHVAVAQRVLLN